MALPTFPSSFPFSPPTPPSRRPTTEINLSRWHNANAEPFLRRRRHQESIERDLRLHRRYDSADRLADVPTPTPSSPLSPSPRSLGTPSSPSKPSIPGRKSKYSKPPHRDSDRSHPAFSSVRRTVRRLPVPEGGSESVVRVGEKGISYKFEDAPFEFQYSYTETPKVKPLALRETVYLPFGPSTMPRPWTGRAPLPPSKKKLPEFDSFRPPPAGKKGVKPVQNPGPFLAGSGPKYSAGTREEVLGEPLTKDEVKDMVRGCLRTTRQLNIGRDGLTHNMLDNIHAHWKRRRVCKIKCKGVCTVDMDNVRQQLEEKTGGKVIYSRGGVIFLFRGRNYNYKTRPRYPLMLWKPTPPVYPKLAPRVPEGLTLEEATEMRNKGRDLTPICKLGKNGVYVNLVNNVKEAFEECELVRINCQGLNKSDCRKIGAKLKDLVPCVLISFEYEHILLWRGREWKSSLPSSDNPVEAAEAAASISVESPPSSANSSQADKQDLLESHVVTDLSKDGLSFEVAHEISLETSGSTNESKEEFDKKVAQLLPDAPPAEPNYLEGDKLHSDYMNCTSVDDFASRKSPKDTHHLEIYSGRISMTQKNEIEVQNNFEINSQAPDYSCAESSNSNTGNEKQGILNSTGSPQALDYLSTQSSISNIESDEHGTPNSTSTGSLQRPYLEGVMLLLKQAIDEGSALLLDNNSLDANIVYEKAVDLAKTSPAAPIFRYQIRKQTKKKVTGVGEESNEDMKVEDTTKPEKLSSEKKRPKSRKEHFRGEFPSVVPHGSLNVDELAKLLNT